ncbi:MAG: biopolymer transporter Tol [Microcystaceae cyanobacterium]
MDGLVRGLGLGLLCLLSSCNWVERPQAPTTLNSRYHDEQPTLSGNGRWLAMVSNRNGSSEIFLYDLRFEKFEALSGVNRSDAVVESPSLSQTGRYLVYIASLQGRPQIVLYDRVTKRGDILLPNYRNWVRNPQISPDGRYIVFETARRGQWDIEVLDRGDRIELDIPEGTVINDPNLPN